MLERTIISARVDRRGGVSRRGFLRTIGFGAAGAGLGFHDYLLAAAPELRKQGKSVILLWMQGGPSQFETFDPKPGGAKAMQTAVSGISIAEYWPNVARQMKDIALVRSMTNKEGNHERATYQMHTGYVPSGTLKHPSFGSLITNEIAPKDFDLPGFVSVLGPSVGPGFLPVGVGPFRIQDPARMPNNATTLVAENRYQRRLGLLGKLDQTYATGGARQQVEDHAGLYTQASRMVLSPKLKAFDIGQESTAAQSGYGNSAFGKGCLLARRLVEAGVTFVEVQLNGWDTHQDNNNRVAGLAKQCDPAFANLLKELKDRGKLDSTLVIWMGEFGRTPRINPNSGRDHYPRAFNAACAGGGIKGGQVIGKTNDSGSDVADNPVTVNDLFSTFCATLGIDPKKENQSPVGRPLKIVEGGKVVKQLLG